ncbi:MAG: flagellar hook-length control protein FliK [Phycisphaeraceae bacterium]|nr:flagellar hook-length control protein FliK [Phycisphaeraceae bacterium]
MPSRGEVAMPIPMHPIADLAAPPNSVGGRTTTWRLEQGQAATVKSPMESGASSPIESDQGKGRGRAARDDASPRADAPAADASAAPAMRPLRHEDAALLMATLAVDNEALGVPQLEPVTELLVGAVAADDPAALPTGAISAGRNAAVQESPHASSGALPAPGAGAAGLRLVERGVHALLQQRGGTLVMRLSPPELGTLEIRMRFEAGRIEVLFRGGAEASRLLEGNLSMLRQSFERQGISVGRLGVEPTEFRRVEETTRQGLGDSFDAGGHASQGRQEAERELRRRSEVVFAMASVARPIFEAPGDAEGSASCPSSPPPLQAPRSFPAASAS